MAFHHDKPMQKKFNVTVDAFSGIILHYQTEKIVSSQFTNNSLISEEFIFALTVSQSHNLV